MDCKVDKGLVLVECRSLLLQLQTLPSYWIAAVKLKKLDRDRELAVKLLQTRNNLGMVDEECAIELKP